MKNQSLSSNRKGEYANHSTASKRIRTTKGSFTCLLPGWLQKGRPAEVNAKSSMNQEITVFDVPKKFQSRLLMNFCCQAYRRRSLNLDPDQTISKTLKTWSTGICTLTRTSRPWTASRLSSTKTSNSKNFLFQASTIWGCCSALQRTISNQWMCSSWMSYKTIYRLNKSFANVFRRHLLFY